MRLCWMFPIKTAGRVVLIKLNPRKKTIALITKNLPILHKDECQKKQEKDKKTVG